MLSSLLLIYDGVTIIGCHQPRLNLMKKSTQNRSLIHFTYIVNKLSIPNIIFLLECFPLS